jgi:DNA-binding HxlR family transcriptional regulator
MIRACKTKEFNGKSYRCYFELTLLVMGGKWKPIILYHLGREGVMRFSALRRSMPGVTERMLARQLRELEADRVVTRTVHREVPPRVEYALTDLGAGLVPILEELRDWGAAYEERLGGPEAFAGEGYEQPLARASGGNG